MCLAIPGRVLSVVGDNPLWREGKVDFAGVTRQVSLACVPEAAVGSYVLVHAGMAISVVDEVEAQSVIEQIRRMGDTAEAGEGP